MAAVVIGLGTSHSSQLNLQPQDWHEQARLDRSRTPFDALLRDAGERFCEHLEPAAMLLHHERAQQALASLATLLQAARPETVIIVGDDQGEMFSEDLMPAIAVATASELWDLPPNRDELDPIRLKSLWAFHGEVAESYPIDQHLALHLTNELVGNGFDLAVVGQQPEGRSLGHAWTFVRRRLMGREPIPIVPVLLNTYYPPNQPTASRCLDLGAAIRRAVESFDAPSRVAIVASGGLSHFVIDESLDRQVIECLTDRDHAGLAALAQSTFRSGTSEILNWIAVAGSFPDVDMHLVDYVPAYRSEAGTGCGFAFGIWQRGPA